MDITHLIDPLNDTQREAVSAPPAHMLVIAGAGSGKTRVLAHRIAWLLQVERVSPFSILAVTFTNKAAAEMRGRIEELLESPAGGMWTGTFHGIAHRLLRFHWQEAGLPQGFQILDSDDQYRLVKRVVRELELDEERWPARQAQWFINGCKDEGVRPAQVDDQGDHNTAVLLTIYQAYEAACARGGLVDFAELLLRALELLRDNPELLTHYQQRFQHVLVDEFQDTNAIQYAWLRLLVGSDPAVAGGTSGWLFVVGDDDQSIYGWRGARIENIQQFTRHYPGAKTIRLEQNYRSTGTILAASNAVIARNSTRLGKELWTAHGEGEPIYLYQAINDLDEAHFVVERIGKWVDEGGLRSECAILYRSNAQSRVLEDALLQRGMPYRVHGGLRFFERAEIRDAMAYLRLINNRGDDAAFERVVNVPARGIGVRTVDVVRELARESGLTLWQAALQLRQQQRLTARAANALGGFLRLIDRLDNDIQGFELAEQVEHIRLHSGLVAHFSKEKGERAQARLDNLEELVNAARSFIVDEEDGVDSLLTGFLSHAALEAGEAQGDAWEDCVQLMTLHSAKGLEFPLVFLAGVEEGLFPHRMSAEDPVRLEEERRLCYVGMTRAMRVLYLTFAERRRLHGKDAYPRVSRFIGEIPRELMQEVRMRCVVGRPSIVGAVPSMQSGLKLGQPVQHTIFGAGVILCLEGEGEQARVQVNFETGGCKWLMVSLARLQPV